MEGAYIIISKLTKESKIKIGKLDIIDFEDGYYCYVGSACGGSANIENRTNRHKRLAAEKKGKLRWHIDYFLTNLNVSIIDVKTMENGDECKLSKSLERVADKTIRGFGSSDCKVGCTGHLHYFKNISKANLDILIR